MELNLVYAMHLSDLSILYTQVEKFDFKMKTCKVF